MTYFSNVNKINSCHFSQKITPQTKQKSLPDAFKTRLCIINVRHHQDKSQPLSMEVCIHSDSDANAAEPGQRSPHLNAENSIRSCVSDKVSNASNGESNWAFFFWGGEGGGWDVVLFRCFCFCSVWWCFDRIHSLEKRCRFVDFITSIYIYIFLLLSSKNMHFMLITFVAFFQQVTLQAHQVPKPRRNSSNLAPPHGIWIPLRSIQQVEGSFEYSRIVWTLHGSTFSLE